MTVAPTVRPSPNQSPRPQPIDCIVLHADAGRTAAGTLAWLADPASKVSYHYLIDRDGAKGAKNAKEKNKDPISRRAEASTTSMQKKAKDMIFRRAAKRAERNADLCISLPWRILLFQSLRSLRPLRETGLNPG